MSAIRSTDRLQCWITGCFNVISADGGGAFDICEQVVDASPGTENSDSAFPLSSNAYQQGFSIMFDL